MSLTAGTRLGSYEIRSVLGAGGMGEVCRAHDSRLERDVALKVLPPSVVADPERVARFEREAKLLAALTSVQVSTAGAFTNAPPVKISSTRYFTANQTRSYDVTPDGRRFLFIKDAPVNQPQRR